MQFLHFWTGYASVRVLFFFNCAYKTFSYIFSASLTLSSSPHERVLCSSPFALLSSSFNLGTTNLLSLFPAFTPALRPENISFPCQHSMQYSPLTLLYNLDLNNYSFSFQLYILISLLWSMPSYGQYHTAQLAGLNSCWLSQSNKASWGI